MKKPCVKLTRRSFNDETLRMRRLGSLLGCCVVVLCGSAASSLAALTEPSSPEQEADRVELLIPAAVRADHGKPEGRRWGPRSDELTPVLLWNGDAGFIPDGFLLSCADRSEWESVERDLSLWLVRNDGKVAVRETQGSEEIIFHCLRTGRTVKIEAGSQYVMSNLSDRYLFVAKELVPRAHYLEEDESIRPELLTGLDSVFLSGWSGEERGATTERSSFLVDLDMMQSMELDTTAWCPMPTLVPPGSDRLVFFGPARRHTVVSLADQRMLIRPAQDSPNRNLLGDFMLSLGTHPTAEGLWWHVRNVAEDQIVYSVDAETFTPESVHTTGAVFARTVQVGESVLLLPPEEDAARVAGEGPPAPIVLSLTGYGELDRIGYSNMLEAVPFGGTEGVRGVIYGSRGLETILPPLFDSSLDAGLDADCHTFAWSQNEGGAVLAFHESDPSSIRIFEFFSAPFVASSFGDDRRALRRYAIARRYGRSHHLEYPSEVIDTSGLLPLSEFGVFAYDNIVEESTVWPSQPGRNRLQLFAGVLGVTDLDCRDDVYLIVED